jgi:hypothetical protein
MRPCELATLLLSGFRASASQAMPAASPLSCPFGRPHTVYRIVVTRTAEDLDQ